MDKEAKVYFSFDGETNGLWGQAFSIGAVVFSEEGVEVDRFIGRCPIEGSIDPWVRDNVLPQMEDISETYGSYKDLLSAFAKFWLEWKESVVATVTHMGTIVEAKIVRDMHDFGFLGDWEAPYVTIDVCSFPLVRDSVDTYAKTHGIKVNPSDFKGGTHNPLFDSAVAGLVYLDVIKK